MEVKRFGVRLICDGDLEKSDETFLSLSSSSENSIVCAPDLDELVVAGTTAMLEWNPASQETRMLKFVCVFLSSIGLVSVLVNLRSTVA